MDEARRFLRYVIPGLVLIIEVSLYSWVSIDLFFADKKFFEELKNLFLKNNIAAPISAFLASGGAGFLLGVIYYTAYWPILKRFSLGVDHTELINDAINRGWLKLRKREKDDTFVNADKLNIFGAWRIVTSLWHERKESSEKIKAANPRIDSLTDIMHGSGTMFIGSIIAIPLWVSIHYRFLGEWPCGYYIAIPIIMSVIHLINFRFVSKNFQSIVDIIMADILEEEKKTPIIINVAKIDLKRNKGGNIYAGKDRYIF